MSNIPERIEVFGDKGYEGMAKVYPRHAFVAPQKKPKGGQLTTEARETNRWISKVRIIAENAINRVRKFRVTRRAVWLLSGAGQEAWAVLGCRRGGLVNLRRMKALAAGVL